MTHAFCQPLMLIMQYYRYCCPQDSKTDMLLMAILQALAVHF